MRTLIVDDERLARVVLKELLSAHPRVEVVGEADSLQATVDAVQRLDPELIFLDIQLSDGTGLALFEMLDIQAKVVFTTAWDHYALCAFELNALDYLLKPVEPQRLAKTLRRAFGESAPVVVQTHAPLALTDLLCLQHRGCMKFFKVSQIHAVEACNDYCQLRLEDGSSLLSSKALKYWKERLPADFRQVHRSHIVRLDAVADVLREGSSYTLRMRSGETVPMSRRRGAELLHQLQADRG